MNDMKSKDINLGDCIYGVDKLVDDIKISRWKVLGIRTNNFKTTYEVVDANLEQYHKKYTGIIYRDYINEPEVEHGYLTEQRFKELYPEYFI